MGKSQRTKGASYEREVCAAINEALSLDVKRNIGQARDGGNDIDCGPLVIECKRRKTLKTIRDWFDQARAACVRTIERKALDGDFSPSFPVIVCREDNGESLVLITLQHFLMLAKPAIVGSTDEQIEMFS